jgi:4-amino-4-deoxy-L-arabinose transferase-like glycosyltransferase
MKKSKISTFVKFIKSPIGLIIIAGLALRIILYFIFQPYNHLGELLKSDAEGYHKLALQLLNYGNFQIPGSDLDTFRTPGYPIFIYSIYSIFGVKPYMVLFIQIFLNLASVYFLYLIGENLFNRSIGVISAFLLSIELDHIYFTYSFLTDTLFVFLFLLACLIFIWFFKRNKISYLIVSSFLLGISTFVRPITILFPFVLIFIMIISAIKSKKYTFKETVQHGILIIVIFSLTLSPWIIRNYKVYGYLKLSSFSGYNLLNYNAAYTIKKSVSRSIEMIRAEQDSMVIKKGDPEKLTNPFYKSEVQTDIALDYVKKHKISYLKSHLLGMINIYSSMEYKPFAHRFFNTKDFTEGTNGNHDKFSINPDRIKTISLPVLIVGAFYAMFFLFYYLTALSGCIMLFIDKRYILLLSLVGLIFYFSILTGVVGLARYKLPISPAYILFSGYCIYFLQRKYEDFRSKKLSEKK